VITVVGSKQCDEKPRINPRDGAWHAVSPTPHA
jgi:hypothetical protein